MSCTEADWLRWLPAALGDNFHKIHADANKGHAGVRIGDGALGLKWQVEEPRTIGGLIRMPCLRVQFRFAGVEDALRLAFMVRFDLYMQRGGG